MTTIRQWLVGKKTYLLAGILLLVTVGLVATGKLTPQTAMSVALVAACGFPITFRAALANHQAQILEVLGEAAESGAALATRNYTAFRAAATAAGDNLAVLVPEIRDEVQPPVPTVTASATAGINEGAKS